tara:strand:+ start:777 stop:1235 length:459 start_codon:yes stop_codon:yes gene_type:complete
MLVNPRKVLIIVSSFPATGVWFAWYFGQWSLMVTCLLLAVPIMICDAVFNRRPWVRVYEIAILLLFYLPLVLYAFARLYQTGGLIYNGEVTHDFVSALYFSVVTWTTLGFGDFQPVENLRLWAAGQALFGYVFMAILVALFLQILTQQNKKA